MAAIKYLTIHCAATREGQNLSADQLNAVAAQRFGPGSKSYHWIVLLDGTKVHNIPDTVRGIHVANANTGNIGVVYVGGVERDGKTPKDTRTDAQKRALREIVDEYRAKYPGIIVRGHRDWPGVNKACPSFDVKAWLAGAESGAPATPAPVPSAEPSKDSIRKTQAFLNGMIDAGVIALPHLDEDGLMGKKTSAALTAFRAALLGI